MSAGIGVGDLVMVVKPEICCGHPDDMGKVFVVAELPHDYDTWDVVCRHCGDERPMNPSVHAAMGEDDFIEFCRLKKLDPPAEGDSLPTRADIEIPA